MSEVISGVGEVIKGWDIGVNGKSPLKRSHLTMLWGIRWCFFCVCVRRRVCVKRWLCVFNDVECLQVYPCCCLKACELETKGEWPSHQLWRKYIVCHLIFFFWGWGDFVAFVFNVQKVRLWSLYRYGSKEVPGIPPNSWLEFSVELVDVKWFVGCGLLEPSS